MKKRNTYDEHKVIPTRNGVEAPAITVIAPEGTSPGQIEEMARNQSSGLGRFKEWNFKVQE